MNTQIVRILFYNAILAGIGMYFITNFFNSDYNSVTFLFFLIGLLIIDAWIDRKRFNYYGIKKPTKEIVKYSVIVFALLFPISIATRVFAPNFDAEYANSFGLNATNFMQFLLFILPISILSEEIGIRSLFQTKVTSKFGSKLAVYATIINFALLHSTWAFSANLPNFAIIMGTVFLYSIFLALLFNYTKNIFSTIIVHFFVNIASSFQIIYHITNQFYSEMVVWLVWGILFILVFPYSIEFLKKSFSLLKGKIPNFPTKALLVLLSIFSLITIIFVHGFLY